jgi:hypothetical protein
LFSVQSLVIDSSTVAARHGCDEGWRASHTRCSKTHCRGPLHRPYRGEVSDSKGRTGQK